MSIATLPRPVLTDSQAETVAPRETMRRLPAFVQPYLTWVTGTPLRGGRPLIRWSPAKAGLLGLTQMIGGIALGTLLLPSLTLWTAPILALTLLTIAGGMRRLDVVVVHQTLHRMFTKTARGDRIVGELITTLFWRMPYDENRREHLLHHQYPCSLKDADTLYLLSVGMRPGMSRKEFRRFIWRSLFAPSHHWRFFSGRIRNNYFATAIPRYRLAMSLAYLVLTIAFVAATGWWLQWLVLWFVPVSLIFQGATYLYTQTEHRWWIFSNAEKLTRAERDLLTFGRMCGERVPEDGSKISWAIWWLRLILVHSPYRLFVLVGDTVQHDLHHVQPGCDWASSPYVRLEHIERGSTRYTDVWGGLVNHLHEAGMVGQAPPRRPGGWV